ncbi:MerR family transcriptional regulator [Formosa sp. S-31]|uniref:MerR family transcriptional regulator n=1 Tax=Formosa sp. S-31 TaxID=2790949 RepID=UPI003EBE11E1
MSKYTMAQIVSLTGIKSHTLRKWESRYSFLVPERTETNIRFYTDTQLKKLLNIGILTQNGYRISKIDAMTEAEIHQLVSELVLKGAPKDEVKALILAMMHMDQDRIHDIINAEQLKSGLITCITQLIYPFLNQVGVLWGNSKVMPAQEHFISNIIKQKLFTAIELLPKPQSNAPKALLFLPENEHHEIGLLLASYITQKLGWRVFYLGQNVPTENIKTIIEISEPDIAVTMFTTSTEERMKALLKTYITFSDIPILTFGPIKNPDFLKRLSHKIKFLSTPEALIHELQHFQTNPV